MSRWIDADALAKKLTDWSTGTVEPIDWSDIAVAPSIDIVRCGECKHCVPYSTCNGDYQMCMRWEDYSCDVSLNDFCSYGERDKDTNVPNKWQTERSGE